MPSPSRPGRTCPGSGASSAPERRARPRTGSMAAAPRSAAPEAEERLLGGAAAGDVLRDTADAVSALSRAAPPFNLAQSGEARSQEVWQ